MTAYTIVPADRGQWRILRDGQTADSYVYNTEDRAQEIADRYADLDRLNAGIETAIGQTRHYGIQVWSEPNPSSDIPIWRITDPHHGQTAYAFAHYLATPPAVSVYTRGQYERACTAANITPANDTDLGNYADKYFQANLAEHPAATVIEHTLRMRRLAGILREQATDAARREQQLAVAGLADGPYSRDQYERAADIMGVDALNDGAVLTVVDQHVGQLRGSGVFDVTVPRDRISVDLARRRVAAIEQEAADRGVHCDECGALIVGTAMVASLGRACSVTCFDAMADRPGRYASKAAR